MCREQVLIRLRIGGQSASAPLRAQLRFICLSAGHFYAIVSLECASLRRCDIQATSLASALYFVTYTWYCSTRGFSRPWSRHVDGFGASDRTYECHCFACALDFRTDPKVAVEQPT